ncbi:hypothetical protein K2173_026165 [Erythroxylum novogranatense]|uniref:Protein kinase domain-containing protein n=1 Tax=Erythroxylum novogranatense TaxID=1862640 RepID=A0AAV8TA96_9ROSI|nr:hypothetical protein K2173_026165 [Erythroxylum novogranatense]
MLLVLLSKACLVLSLCTLATVASSVNLLQLSDAAALLAFKSKADLKDILPYTHNTSFNFCQWQGVKCFQRKVARLVVQGLDLGGVFAPDTLSRLDQLRVLSLQSNSLTGPIPDLSKLINLKSLFLDHNSFTGSFPHSIFSLHRVRTLDLSYNNLTGAIPAKLISLERLYYLCLEWNNFNGSIPPLNQSSLQTFNVSFNNLTGAIPVTPTLLRFGPSAFLSNPSLCGKIIEKECRPSSPFFGPLASTTAVAPPPVIAIDQSENLHGVDFDGQSPKGKHKRTVAVIIGFSSALFVLAGSLLCFVIAIKKIRNQQKDSKGVSASESVTAPETVAVMQIDQQENELEERVKRVQRMHVSKSGNLLFCAGETQLYTLDQLMRGSAELLGRGTIGTTYKAVLDNRLIVSVKRLDSSKLVGTARGVFEGHMESVGGLRHPNLVPLRAYFQNGEERLLIYDYQHNGSLFSLIHGSKSTRAKPLHWTSCLKIAEDVAQGLSYIHQAWRLVHGNLKSTNILLGPDFEACVADYCLTVLANSTPDDDPDNAAYKAPETRDKHNHQATAKSDVYSYGILLLEVLTGKLPSELPAVIVPYEIMKCIKSCRELDDGVQENRLEMLLEVAITCSLTSTEQRPTMWQVLKVLQEIKETVLMEDAELDPHGGLS